MKAEELTKKREEAERKARRGEIDPTHEFTFHLIGQVGTRVLWWEDCIDPSLLSSLGCFVMK